MNFVRDISEPAYAQFLKVEGADNENTTVSATQSHMVKKFWSQFFFLLRRHAHTVISLFYLSVLTYWGHCLGLLLG